MLTDEPQEKKNIGIWLPLDDKPLDGKPNVFDESRNVLKRIIAFMLSAAGVRFGGAYSWIEGRGVTLILQNTETTEATLVQVKDQLDLIGLGAKADLAILSTADSGRVEWVSIHAPSGKAFSEHLRTLEALRPLILKPPAGPPL